MSAHFYADIERMKSLNRALQCPDFFAGRGYGDLSCVPALLRELAFPVYSPVDFLTGRETSVLDAGCGAGLDLFLIAARYPHMRLTGIDRSEQLAGVARRHVQADIIEGDASSHCFEDARFDACIMNGCFNLIRDKSFFVGELRRILSPAGAACICDIFRKTPVSLPLPDDDDFNLAGAMTLKDFFTIFRNAGFVYEAGHFEAGYTREFGLFAVKWRKI